MALTPEDVVKKEFSKPKGFGRNGYDEIQVDDFLDEIVVELRRLNAENDSLSDKLDDCRRSHGGDGDATMAGQPKQAAVPALTPVNNAAAPAAGGSSDEDKAPRTGRLLRSGSRPSVPQTNGRTRSAAAKRRQQKQQPARQGSRRKRVNSRQDEQDGNYEDEGSATSSAGSAAGSVVEEGPDDALDDLDAGAGLAVGAHHGRARCRPLSSPGSRGGVVIWR